MRFRWRKGPAVSRTSGRWCSSSRSRPRRRRARGGRRAQGATPSRSCTPKISQSRRLLLLQSHLKAAFKVKAKAADGTTEATSPVHKITVNLDPGDCLYIPAGWWHATENLPGNRSGVSAEVGVSLNFSVRLATRRSRCRGSRFRIGLLACGL